MIRINSRTLGNGLKVSICPFIQLETVGIAFGVNFGSIDEKPRINGAAHFLEHMLFKGTKKRTWKQIDDQLKDIGAYHNAFTDHETTVYFVQVYKGYFERAMRIISDMVRNSTIPPKEFELERGPIINENLIRHDNPRYMLLDYMPRALYRRHPARLAVGGDNEKTIMNVKREDLVEIYSKHYSPENSVLAVYGGVSAQAALKSAGANFGDFYRAFTKKERHAAREAQQRRSISISRKGIKQTRIAIGFKCGALSAVSRDEFVAMQVVERYLGDRLFDEIRQKRGLSYDPMVSYNPYSTFGYIAAAAGVEPKRVAEAKSIMLDEFRRLQEGEMEKQEIERTKRALRVEFVTSRESSIGMSTNMAVYELMYGGAGLLASMPGLISKVSMDSIRRYCSKYIDAKKYGMVQLRPG